MEFRDLKKQYLKNREAIDKAIQKVILDSCFIGGEPVTQLEEKLADFVGVRNCITCANGTDALQLALMAWGIKKNDAVFVPAFTFFSTAEVIPWVGATPVFVDVDIDTFNISAESLEAAIIKVKKEGRLFPKVVIAVDLFGQPADYYEIIKIAKKYNLLLLEDGAQGFGGNIEGKKACSFGNIATTSFFPAKPLGCYGDGGAVFTDNEEWASLVRSYKVHGKGVNKYDNVRIGINSRLDTIQAAILLAKLSEFATREIDAVNSIADYYDNVLKETAIDIPVIKKGYQSSWAQYTVKLRSREVRNNLQQWLKENQIPSMIYYAKPMHKQEAFKDLHQVVDLYNTEKLCQTVLSLPIHPYMEIKDVELVGNAVKKFFDSNY